MTEFIEKHHLLKETQSGSRKELSTSKVAIKLQSTVSSKAFKTSVTVDG